MEDGGGVCVCGGVGLHLYFDGQFSSFQFNARINSTPRSFKLPVKKVQCAHPASKAAIDLFSHNERDSCQVNQIFHAALQDIGAFLCLCC